MLQIKNVSKEYPGVTALNNISIDFHDGEVHALVGENGAGKSTLIKIISGAETPTSGQIVLDDEVHTSMTPALSKKYGIAVIYQEFTLIPTLSVAENLFLGDYPHKNSIIDKKLMEEKSREIFKKMGVEINPRTLIRDLTVAYMQMVEIAKAIIKDAKILIMDEPTAPLTNKEVSILMELIKKLRDQGISIIYISHRMNEIYELADRLTILRDGKRINEYPIDEISRNELIRQMVGRDMNETFPERANAPGEVVLAVKDVSGPGVEDITFSLKRGEILGLAGLVGAGRTEIARILFGANKLESGDIFIEDKKVEIKSPLDAVNLGIGLVPEDRKQQGVILSLPVKDNLTLSIIRSISRFSVINTIREKLILKKQKENLLIKTPSYMQKVKNLSGGNQQKVVLGKWLAGSSRILIFDEPTRGIDVGAKQEIYNLMNNLTKEGISIIMISSEMEEVIGMSDRIIVLHEGRISGTLDRNDFSQERIMKFASGIA